MRFTKNAVTVQLYLRDSEKRRGPTSYIWCGAPPGHQYSFRCVMSTQRHTTYTHRLDLIVPEQPLPDGLPQRAWRSFKPTLIDKLQMATGRTIMRFTRDIIAGQPIRGRPGKPRYRPVVAGFLFLPRAVAVCPRCGGSVKEESDRWGVYRACISCGRPA